WVDSLSLIKKSGDLYNIYGNLYYVSKVKNTYFSDHVISEVEFSKDFNRLSQIIGIPSEPRFYEISERSSIKREISLDDYIVVGTSVQTTSGENSFIKENAWEYIASLLLGQQTQFPKYAITMFKNDVNKETAFGNESFLVKTCHPICAYSIENSLTLEWDMKDNFSAGDQVLTTERHKPDQSVVDTAYNTLIPFRYADIYGRCDMIDFAIMTDYNFTNDEVMLLPKNPIDITLNKDKFLFGNNLPEDYGKHDRGIIVLKDNRESLSFNYNLQTQTDSDRFVLSAYMWRPNKTSLKLALLKEEVNKISNETIPDRNIIVSDIPFSYVVDKANNNIKINISQLLTDYAISKGTTLDKLLENANAIALIASNDVSELTDSGETYFIMARNITGLEIVDASKNWFISNYNK
ncbi:MAG: hypothetical protein RR334_03735, partial [Clostridia bacterium]